MSARSLYLVVLSLLALTFAAVACAQQDDPAPTTKPETQTDRVSYAIGLNLGRNLKSDEISCSVDYLMRGLEDGLEGTTSLLSNEEIQAAMQALQQEVSARQQAAAGAAASTNESEGEAFLVANGQKAGVTTLPSGLQYEVVEQGTGPSPKATDTVSVHYSGTLIDGTKFDSSYDRGQPATFPVTGVIPGWTEALQLMNVGAKWKLYIPSKLAYGERGTQGGPIGPNATLIFDVELLGIE